MMDLLKGLMASALRIEKKLDEILKMQKLKDPQYLVQGLNYTGQVCPLCNRPVMYKEMSTAGPVGRSCGCTVNPGPRTTLLAEDGEKDAE